MGMTLIDAYGNHHTSVGQAGAGQFSTKNNSAPAGQLEPFEDDVKRAQETIEQVAKAASRNYRFDQHTTQDIIQESWVDLLNRRKPLSELIQEDNKNLLKLVTRTIATRHSVGAQHGFRHEDFQARRELRDDEDLFEDTNGRRMTKSERESAAERIRMSRPAGRRPKPDFYIQRSTFSIDAALDASESDGRNFADLLENPEPTPADESSSAAYALWDYENSDKATRAKIREDVWRLATESVGAPQPSPGALTDRSRIEASRAVIRSTDGGAAGAAGRWLDGTSPDDEADALFAPFSGQDLSMHDRDRVAQALLRHPAYAQKLWESAMTTASRAA